MFSSDTFNILTTERKTGCQSLIGHFASVDVKQNVYLLTEDWLIPNNMRSGKCYSVVWVVRAGDLAGHPMFPRMGAEGGPSACQGAGQLVFPCVGAEGGASGGQGAGHLVCLQLCGWIGRGL